MPIQLVITGDHITDVFAEITNFAAAIGSGEVVHTVQVAPVNAQTARKMAEELEEKESKPAPKVETKKTLTREEQDNAVEEMIEAGEKDARYDQLTKGRQKNVDDGIAAKTAEPATAEDDLDDMFDEEPAEAEITTETIRTMMAALCKDEDGNQIKDILVKIKDILVRFIPKGSDIKVGNIPQDKLAAVHAELKKMEG